MGIQSVSDKCEKRIILTEMQKKRLLSIFFKLLFCVAVYGLMLTENLVNNMDGIWNGPYKFAGDWELSIGRWMIPYVDKFHFGISINPFVSIITLLLFSVGTEIFSSVFDLKVGFINYLVSFLFLGNVIVCVTLSYAYTSIAYGLCFLLSMLSVWLIKKSVQVNNSYKRWLLLLISAFCMAMTMGLYQAYLGCILVSVFAMIMKMTTEENKKIFSFVMYSIVTELIGAILYVAILGNELDKNNIYMSPYNGANSFSIKNIFLNLDDSIRFCYQKFYQYFTGTLVHHNMFETSWVINVIIGIIFAFAILMAWIILRKNKILFIIYLVCFCTIPIACNIIKVILPSSSFIIQQSCSFAIVLPALLAVYLPCMRGLSERFFLLIEQQKYKKAKEQSICLIVRFVQFFCIGCILIYLWGASIKSKPIKWLCMRERQQQRRLPRIC